MISLKSNYLTQANEIKNEIVEIRRSLHKNAETGFDLTETIKIIKDKLTELSCDFTDCGKNGIVCVIGKKNNKPAFLLRADMDALPVAEQTNLEYACENGNMHACGHDMHSAMLLGAAKLLKEHENELEGQVKLVFEPAEEILSGAKNMIENGVLTSPEVGGAFMLHVMAGVPQRVGTAIVSGGGVSAPGADYFTINVKGKGCHGSMPQQGIDAITVAAHILIALQEISARELGVEDAAVITVGSFCGGNAGNVIADCANMYGTLRTFNEDLRAYIKKRIECIVNSIAQAFRADACVTYTSGCPSLINDSELSSFMEAHLKSLLGEDMVLSSTALGMSIKGGSDDFAYISREVPSITIALAAGEPEKGFTHPQHHPKVMFDEECLPVGAAIYAHIATEWLKEESKH